VTLNTITLNPNLYNVTSSAMKSGLVVSLEGNNLVVYYHLSASEIWPDIREVAFGGSGLIKRRLL